MEIFLGLLLLINLCGFIMMAYDKSKARKPGARRVPERNLLLVALAGGAVGVYLGLKIFRHKTKHPVFSIGIPVIILIHVTLYLLVNYWS